MLSQILACLGVVTAPTEGLQDKKPRGAAGRTEQEVQQRQHFRAMCTFEPQAANSEKLGKINITTHILRLLRL